MAVAIGGCGRRGAIAAGIAAAGGCGGVGAGGWLGAGGECPGEQDCVGPAGDLLARPAMLEGGGASGAMVEV